MSNLFTPPRTVKFDIQSADSNAYFIIAAWSKQARHENWDQDAVETVRQSAKSEDYANLISTIVEHSKFP